MCYESAKGRVLTNNCCPHNFLSFKRRFTCYDIGGTMSTASALIFLVLISTTFAANILMIHPVVSRSHELVFVTLGEALASKGHNVTLVRFWHPKAMKTRLVHSVMLYLKNDGNSANPVPYMTEDGAVEPPHDMLWKSDFTITAVPLDIVHPIRVACETLLDNSTYPLIFNTAGGEEIHYDVAIVDILTNECALALAYHFRLPVIGYWATFAHGGELFWTSSPSSPSFVPAMLTGYTDRMSFLQRFINSFYYLGSRIFSQLVMINPPNQVISRQLPGTPNPTELIQNISFLFINSDFSLDYPRPIVPNVAYIGCIQCHPTTALSQELEDFMQSSGDYGVIVFSMGATFNSKSVPVAVVQDILDATGLMKQKVIMKIDKNPQFKIPPNVYLTNWFPQQDILGHNKTRLFITHCGMHSVMESIYHRVPMLGIPLFADQWDICTRMVAKGIAVQIDKFDITRELMVTAMKHIISNKTYLDNVNKVSVLLRDQVQTPLNRALYWVEYVIRHNGADHLKCADRFLNIFQYLLIDVVIITAILFTIFIYASKKIFQFKFNSKKVLVAPTSRKTTTNNSCKKLKKP